jgi:predicted acetyltransferase
MRATARVRPAAASERPLIEGLFQFYAYDFSELEPADSPRFDFDRRGGFGAYEHLPAYWRDKGGWPLLIEVDGRLAGFALVNTASPHGGTVERNMGEFFVARKFRRGGIGAEAVRQILGLLPGHWEVAVAERNAAAKLFWPKAIAGAGVSGLIRRQGDGERWNGPIWSFDAGGDPVDI